MIKYIYSVFLVFLLLLISCGTKKEAEVTMTPELQNALIEITNSRVFFGHQSVGENIIDGLTTLTQEAKINGLNILEINSAQTLPEFFFVHSRVGKNREPQTKCRDFSSIIRNQLSGQKLQGVILKFCYVDIKAKSDVQQIFNQYRATVDSLQAEFPELKFIHLTVPLKAKTAGMKARIMLVFGKLGRREQDNIKRFEFNELIRACYKDRALVDVAQIESTYADGSRETFTKNGKTYYNLIPAYSYDGGHLNKTGSKLIAKAIVLKLAEQL